MTTTEQPVSDQVQDLSRVIREQLFWGMLGPLVPNVLLMAVIYNLRFETYIVLAAGITYWILASAFAAFFIKSRARHNGIGGNAHGALFGARVATLLVVLSSQIAFSIFTTFAEEPIYAFIFILLVNLFGTLGALVGFYSEKISEHLATRS